MFLMMTCFASAECLNQSSVFSVVFELKPVVLVDGNVNAMGTRVRQWAEDDETTTQTGSFLPVWIFGRGYLPKRSTRFNNLNTNHSSVRSAFCVSGALTIISIRMRSKCETVDEEVIPSEFKQPHVA